MEKAELWQFILFKRKKLEKILNEPLPLAEHEKFVKPQAQWDLLNELSDWLVK